VKKDVSNYFQSFIDVQNVFSLN